MGMTLSDSDRYLLAVKMAESPAIRAYFKESRTADVYDDLLKFLPEAMVSALRLILEEERDMYVRNEQRKKRRHQVNKSRLLQRGLRVRQEAEKALNLVH